MSTDPSRLESRLRAEAALRVLGVTPATLTAVPPRQANRWVYRVCLAGAETLFVKIFQDATTYAREAKALATIPAGIGPTVFAALDAECTLVTEGIDGTVAACAPSVDSGDVVRHCLTAFRALLATGIDAPVDPIPPPLGDSYRRQLRYLSDICGYDELTLRAWTATEQPMLPCHGDLTPNNVIITDAGVRLIDFEFFGISQPLHDAASLCLSPSLNLSIDRRATALAHFAQAVADADRQPVAMSTVAGAASMWALRFGQRLYLNRADADAALDWRAPLRVTGKALNALTNRQDQTWNPDDQEARSTR